MADDYRQRLAQALFGFIVATPEATEYDLADAVLAVRDEELERVRAERDQAIAHDRQPYPTQWAYDQACAALATQRERAEQAEAVIARVRTDCEEQTQKPIADDMERGIWAQARRTLNTLDAIPKERT